MKFYLLGRGVMARRTEDLLDARLGGRAERTDGVEEADVLFFAEREDVVETWIADHPDLVRTRLCYDFSGYAKRQESDAIWGLDVLTADAPPQRSGLVALPACYASSVILPVLFLRDRYGYEPREIWSVCLGGRSTLGESKPIEARSGRLASEASAAWHCSEISGRLGIARDRVELTVMVADLEDGIIGRTLLTGEEKPEFSCESVSVTLSAGGWREVALDDAEPVSLPVGEENACVFTLTTDEKGVRVTSRVHNLDLPIEIAFMHLSRSGLVEGMRVEV